MRRWNGWGEETVAYPLGGETRSFLRQQLGPGTPQEDASLESVVAKVPPTRLPVHKLVNFAAEDRVRHARGQSLPDWIDLRSGNITTFPDGVAYPQSDSDVEELLAYAADADAVVIPYGGGTSVVGAF